MLFVCITFLIYVGCSFIPNRILKFLAFQISSSQNFMHPQISGKHIKSNRNWWCDLLPLTGRERIKES